jgi:hypothetical protein
MSLRQDHKCSSPGNQQLRVMHTAALMDRGGADARAITYQNYPKVG